jgi:hypothetical protein
MYKEFTVMGINLSEVFNGPHPYYTVYMQDICNTQEQVFLQIRTVLPGADEKWFIKAYMDSDIRRLLDEGNPYYANMPPREIIWEFETMYGGYEKGEEWGGFLPGWVGYIYALYNWAYNIPSDQLVTMFPLEDMERYWVPFHQASHVVAVEKLHEIHMSELEHLKT